MEHLYRYSICFYNEGTGKDETKSGILCANNYQEAVARLVSVDVGYGEEATAWVRIEDMCDTIMDDEDIQLHIKYVSE